MSYMVQPPLLALKDFLESDTNDRLVLVLGALDLDPLLQRLDRRRGRGRRGYSLRVMLQAVIAAWVYNLHSMAGLRRELLRNGSLRILVGVQSVARVPSEDALSRFFARLAALGEEVDKLHATVIARIRELDPEVGKQAAIDSTAINAWANGNRSEPADPQASWGCKGHKEKGKSAWWFGYKEHLAVDTKAELVLAYRTTTASGGDSKNLKPLLEKLDDLLPAGHLAAVMADAQYDSQDNYEAF
jgi:IS5 family transposase